MRRIPSRKNSTTSFVDDPDIDHWSSYVGRSAIRFYLPLDVQLQNDFFAETIIVTKSLKVRDQVKQRLEAALQEKFPEAVGRVFPLELGPPVGWPVQYPAQRQRSASGA